MEAWAIRPVVVLERKARSAAGKVVPGMCLMLAGLGKRYLFAKRPLRIDV